MADKPIIESVAHLEQSIEALESRNAFQDDVIEQLNHELTIHQEQIADLKIQLKFLATKIKDGSSEAAGKQEIEPPPPHY